MFHAQIMFNISSLFRSLLDVCLETSGLNSYYHMSLRGGGGGERNSAMH